MVVITCLGFGCVSSWNDHVPFTCQLGHKWFYVLHLWLFLELDWVWRQIWRRNGEGNGNPLQCSCLENPRDGGAWSAAVYGVAQSRTRLKRLSSSSMEKEMATHSSVLAWRIPGTGDPDGLPSVRSHRDGLDWSDLAAAAAWVTW